MKNKLTALLTLVVLISQLTFAKTEEEKYLIGYDLVPASINTSAFENSISFYKNNQIILMKPDTKGKSKRPVPFTATIKENGDLGNPKVSKDLGKLKNTGTIAYDSVNNIIYFAKYDRMQKDYILCEAKTVKGKLAVSKMKIDGTFDGRGENQFMVDAGWSYRTIGLAGFKNPSIAKNGNRVFFTAAIKQKEYNSLGSTDIWYVDKKEDGTWTAPINAGKNVNTSVKEDYAFCLGDSVLYFCSTTNKTGIELFKSKLEKNGEWGKSEKLAGHFSSNMNDYNLIINKKNAYFISNRNPKGKDDIYLFVKKPDPPVIPPPIAVQPPPPPQDKETKMKEWHFTLFYFDFDKDVLSEEFTRQFKELVAEMKEFPGETFEVAGHTDQRGSDAYNQKLSDHRAQFVKDLLIKEGFPAENLIAKGFGEKMPVVTDPKSEDEFAQNRRCEIRILSKAEVEAVKAAETKSADKKQDTKPAANSEVQSDNTKSEAQK